MTRFWLVFALLLPTVVSLGCHHCGDRPRLFGRFRDRDRDDDDDRRRLIDRSPSRDPRDCDPCRPVSGGRTVGGSYGQPMLGSPVGVGGTPTFDGGSGFGGFPSYLSSPGTTYPMSPYPGGTLGPTYPMGPTYPGGSGGGDELPPPGSYQGPYAVPRPTDSGKSILPKSNTVAEAKK
jgi:hypothetical protein